MGRVLQPSVGQAMRIVRVALSILISDHALKHFASGYAGFVTRKMKVTLDPNSLGLEYTKTGQVL